MKWIGCLVRVELGGIAAGADDWPQWMGPKGGSFRRAIRPVEQFPVGVGAMMLFLL